jgi:two-component system, OmpR family, sensor histidine kinase CreC
VRMSADKVMIVLSHLADNAQRHGAQALHITGTDEGNVLVATISNDGEAISDANRARVFDAFFTTRRDSGGTGMGLAIVQAMLRAHGGDIALLRPETGVAFEIRFPVA